MVAPIVAVIAAIVIITPVVASPMVATVMMSVPMTASLPMLMAAITARRGSFDDRQS
jgi:hypothetical protein